MREREAKFAVDQTFEVPDLADAMPGATFGAPDEREVVDVYFDTEDLRLLRLGCTLRNRKGKGWLVKLPVARTGRTVVRDEVHFRGRAGKPPKAAVDLVDSFSRGAPLAVVATLATQRIARRWLVDGAMVAEMVDDRVAADPATEEPSTFRQLEVELAPEVEASLIDGVVERLVDAGARPDPAGLKLALAIGDRATEPPDVVVAEVGGKSTGREIIQAALSRSVAQLINELPAARLGEGTAGVHQARVATRRLRSDLRTFAPLLDPSWSAPLDDGLRSLARALGAIRDCDVLLARFRVELLARPSIDADAGRRMVELLEQQRTTARKALLTQLNDPSTHALLDDLVAAAADPAAGPRADERGVKRLRSPVRKRWRQLEKAVNGLGPDPSDSALHQVRILAKRTRYASEAVAGAFGSDAERFAKSMAGVQDVLGELHDAAVAARWLAGAVEQLDPQAAFAAGRLAEQMVADGRRHRHGWEKSYRQAAKNRNRSWFA